MPQDYKHRVEKAAANPPRQRSCVPRFLLGLVIGLAVAVAVQLYHAKLLPAVWPLTLLQPQPQPKPQPKAQPKAQAKVEEPKPRIDFYETLPKLRVEAPPPAQTNPKPLAAVTQAGNYSLQLGSFQKPELAEERKARLALLGFGAEVQTVPHPKTPLYRVKMGPYQDLAQLNALRARLHAHHQEFTLLKENVKRD